MGFISHIHIYLFFLKCGLESTYDELFIYWALVTLYLLRLLDLNDIYIFLFLYLTKYLRCSSSFEACNKKLRFLKKQVCYEKFLFSMYSLLAFFFLMSLFETMLMYLHRKRSQCLDIFLDENLQYSWEYHHLYFIHLNCVAWTS